MTIPDPIGAANADVIQQFIRSATRRLAVLAPAVSMDVAKAIEERWITLGPKRVSVTLDVDAEVYRLGYGDAPALSHLEAVGSQVGGQLQRHQGIRIGIIVADDRTLIYSPIPELVEAGPRDAQAPNAVILDSVSGALEAALGMGARGVQDQTVGLDNVTQAEIADVQQDLTSNPPQKFEIQRQLRVFDAAFRFVELRVIGTNLSRKIVQIPNYLMGVVDNALRNELRTSLKLVPPNDDLSGRDLEKKRRRIDQRYVRDIPGHGSVIRRVSEAEFLQDIEELQSALDAFKERVIAGLDAVIDKKIGQLTEAFLPRMREAPPPHWLLPKDGADREVELKRCLTEELRGAFGSAQDYMSKMKVERIFKGVTYESLRDKTFLTKARKAFTEREVPQLYREFDAAPAADDDGRSA